jgi:hypothetical protein
MAKVIVAQERSGSAIRKRMCFLQLSEKKRRKKTLISKASPRNFREKLLVEIKHVN